MKRKRLEIKKLQTNEISKAYNKDECYAIKKQGLEIVDTQKTENNNLLLVLSKLEEELNYLQVFVLMISRWNTREDKY